MAAQVRLHTQPEGGADVLREASLTALEMFTAVDDHLGLSIVHQTLAEFAGTRARIGDQLRHIRLAAEHSELAGRHHEAQMFHGWGNALLIFDDTPAEQALAESRSLFELAEDRSRRAYTALGVCFFATLLDEREEAGRALALAERLAVGLHESVPKTITLVTSLAALYTGQWPAAARLLAEVCADNEEGGEIGILSTNAAVRAHALLHMAEPGLAREQLELSQRIGGADDVLNQGLIPGALAWLAALDGDRTAWERHIAVATVALPDEHLLNRAVIHETCAEAAAVLGEHSVAHQHRQQALDLHQAKGNVVSVARLRAML
jgi:hypothetical protein